MHMKPKVLTDIKRGLAKKGMTMKDLSIATSIPYNTCNQYINGFMGIPPHKHIIMQKAINARKDSHG